MQHTQSELIEIGKRHFNGVILPKLNQISPDAVRNMMVFIEGSVSYGYCDKYSDVDIDYHIDLPIDNKTLQSIRKSLNDETHWSESIRVSYGFGGNYWKFDKILNDQIGDFWNEFNPYALNNIKQAIPIWDPKQLLGTIQAKVDFYPPEIYKNVLRGLWITINDSGKYNVLEAIRRDNLIEGNIYLYRALEAMIRMVYLLNKRYYPPTKWLSAGIDTLENDFTLPKIINEISSNNDLKKRYDSYGALYSIIKDFISNEKLIEKECIDNYSSTFHKPFFIFNPF